MVILRENFLPLQYLGIWPSVHWQKSTWKYIIYILYATYVVFSIISFALSGLIYMFIVTDDVAEFSDTAFMLLSILAICTKIIIIWLKKSEITGVLNAFEESPHTALNSETQRILDESNARIRLFTFYYGVFIEVTVFVGTITPFFQHIPFGVLPYKSWIPYDYSVPVVYWFTYCQQLISVLIAANLTIGFDTVMVGFIMHICTQFKMLRCQVRMIIDEFYEQRMFSGSDIHTKCLKNYEDRIIDCIEYHLAIYSRKEEKKRRFDCLAIFRTGRNSLHCFEDRKPQCQLHCPWREQRAMRIAEKLNSIFSYIIFVQYSASTIIICVSVLLISQMPIQSSKFMTVFMYLSSVLFQIFMFCAAGNQATLECESVMRDIYHTKWYGLTNPMKKCIFLMMTRSLKPVVFLMKTSYSVYAMLQGNSD